MVEFYGFHVGITIPVPWMLWVRGSRLPIIIFHGLYRLDFGCVTSGGGRVSLVII